MDRFPFYLLDVVPDGEPRFGFPNISDNAEIAELMACGAHLTLFTTGRGSVVGSAIAPVLKICANPETYRRLEDDMDVDAGRILSAGTTQSNAPSGYLRSAGPSMNRVLRAETASPSTSVTVRWATISRGVQLSGTCQVARTKATRSEMSWTSRAPGATG